MARRKTGIHRTALPLFQRIKDKKLSRAKVQRELGIEPQVLTNWLSRGIAARRLPDVAAVCGISTDQYRLECGTTVRNKPKQGSLEAVALLVDFEKLPDGLKAYIERTTAELLEMYETMPSFLQIALKHRPDAASYREWEKGIREMVSKFKGEEV